MHEEEFESKIFDFEFEGNTYYLSGSHQLHPDMENCRTFINTSESSIVFDFEKPWSNNYDTNREGEYKMFRFTIIPSGFPDNTEEFTNFIRFIIFRIIDQGENVNISCNDGVQNTGLVLAAMVKMLNDNPYFNAIEYVRNKYHDDAVNDITQLIYAKHVLNMIIPKEDLPFVKIFENLFEQANGKSIAYFAEQRGFDNIGDMIYNVVPTYEESLEQSKNSNKTTDNISAPNLSSKLSNLSFKGQKTEDNTLKQKESEDVASNTIPIDGSAIKKIKRNF